ncbi:MAG TPA: glycerophosphodiester phosphodiesterase [Terriglobales bacterium]|nr:glycerophosphodiester phosphodiesterase [Terriglobales bacterium]
MSRPLLLGHRGLRLPTEPSENTIAAFDRALELGCDGFEFDVRLTADNYAVICHDPQHSSCEIAAVFYEQVRELALLDDVLARYAGPTFLDIELKVPGLEESTLSALNRHKLQSGFVISSFFPPILQHLRSLDAFVPLGFLCDRDSSLSHWREFPVEYVIPQVSLVTRDLVSECRGAGRKVLVWTVNQAEDMSRLRDWNVDGIISDNPALLVRTVGT